VTRVRVRQQAVFQIMNPVVRAVKTPRDKYFCFRLNALRIEKAVRTGSDGFRHSASAGGAGLLAEPRKLVVGVRRAAPTPPHPTRKPGAVVGEGPAEEPGLTGAHAPRQVRDRGVGLGHHHGQPGHTLAEWIRVLRATVDGGLSCLRGSVRAARQLAWDCRFFFFFLGGCIERRGGGIDQTKRKIGCGRWPWSRCTKAGC
jgi:hypothetical protein